MKKLLYILFIASGLFAQTSTDYAIHDPEAWESNVEDFTGGVYSDNWAIYNPSFPAVEDSAWDFYDGYMQAYPVNVQAKSNSDLFGLIALPSDNIITIIGKLWDEDGTGSFFNYASTFLGIWSKDGSSYFCIKFDKYNDDPETYLDFPGADLVTGASYSVSFHDSDPGDPGSGLNINREMLYKVEYNRTTDTAKAYYKGLSDGKWYPNSEANAQFARHIDLGSDTLYVGVRTSYSSSIGAIDVSYVDSLASSLIGEDVKYFFRGINLRIPAVE